MKKHIFFLLLTCLYIASVAQAQNITQTIRGVVLDKETQSALPYASVRLITDSNMRVGTVTDLDGNFRLDNVALGKQKILVSYIGYQDQVVANLVVNSAKEVVVTVMLEEQVAHLDEAKVVARKKGANVNEMTSVSTHTFTVEETERYAGSRQDPARMASNFAGIQGNNDSRNDLVIRGNSPMGLLYRLENVDIPNPNHFSIAGTEGGPVSILNNKVIGTSDFMTGAFPAEYGNALAGVFDLRMRNGNDDKHEYTFQFGILGTELSGEGPINKKTNSSYLFTYRYSTLKMLAGLKINFGTTAVPNYQDASFKVNFPMGQKNNLSFFGIGGTSTVDIVVSNLTEPPHDIYGENDRDQHFSSTMGVVGSSFSHIINNKAYTKFTIAHSIQESDAHHELVKRDTGYKITAMYPILYYKFNQGKTSLNWYLNKKINTRQTLKIGINNDLITGSFLDSVIADNDTTKTWHNRWDAKGSTILIQPYIQYKYKMSDRLVFNVGLHGQYFGLANEFAVEPRVGAKWQLNEKQTLSAGFGLHSQPMPLYIYYEHKEGSPADAYTNKNAGLLHNTHYILSYDNMLRPNLRMKAETYYQHLYGVPIEQKSSSFSVMNQGSLFERFFPDTLVNKGTGDNYGVELTLEKTFSKHYFVMFSGSAFNSTYVASDGATRNTDFNGRFATNLLAAREFNFGNKTLTLGTKITWAGGKRYSPVDTAKSLAQGEMVIIESQRNSLQFHDYFRADLKIGYKINRKKVTHEIALDLVNVLNTQNVLSLTYVPNPAEPLREEYQLGFLPLFYYKIDF